MRKKIYIALLGGGKIAEHHISAIKKVKNFELAALTDLSKSKRDYYSKKFRIQTFEHYKTMLNEVKKIDIVVIMSPSGMHYEHASKIIKRFKKNVVLEKPPCMNKSQVVSLYNIAKKYKKKIYPVFQSRNNKCIIKIKDEINKNKLGKIRLVNLSLRWCRPQRYYNLSKWRGTYSHDGGVLTNQGIHYLDLVKHLFGDILSVSSKMKTLGAKIEVEDSGVGFFEFRNGALGSLELTTAARPKDFEAKISAVGSKGIVTIGGLSANILKEYSPDNSYCKKYSEKIPNAYGFGHFKMYEDIKDDFINKKKYEINFKDCLETVKLINAFYVSDEKKKTVKVNLSGNSKRLGRANEDISKIYK